MAAKFDRGLPSDRIHGDDELGRRYHQVHGGVSLYFDAAGEEVVAGEALAAIAAAKRGRPKKTPVQVPDKPYEQVGMDEEEAGINPNETVEALGDFDVDEQLAAHEVAG